MHPLIELLFNPLAGDSLNMVAIGLYMAVFAITITAYIERG